MFEWDEKKRLKNIEKHRLDFFVAIRLFDGLHIVVPSDYDGDEERFLAIGLLEDRFVTVVFAYRGNKIRIISFRRARHEERRRYQDVHGGRA
jgi:uncharacterized DUF497 family protein